MESIRNFPQEGKVEVDETYVGGQDEQAIRRKGGAKKIVVVAIEQKGKGVSRMYAQVIETASKENVKLFMQDHIKHEANVRIDKWRGYTGLEKGFPNMVR